MTYEEAIQALSRTPFDVTYHGGIVQVVENVGGELIKRGNPVSFGGDWEDGIILGAGLIGDLQPSKQKKKRSRRKK